MSEKKKTITEVRDEKAQKLLDYLTNDLEVEAAEVSKVISRAYNKFKKKK